MQFICLGFLFLCLFQVFSQPSHIGETTPDPLDTVQILTADATYDYQTERVTLQLKRGPGILKKVVLETEDTSFNPTWENIQARANVDPCFLYNEVGVGFVNGGWDMNHVYDPEGWNYETTMTIEQLQKCGGVTEINENGVKTISAVFHGLLEAEKKPSSDLIISGNNVPAVIYTQEFRTTIFFSIQTEVDAALPCMKVSKTSQYHFMVLEHSESILDDTGAHQDSYITVNYPAVGASNDIFEHITVDPNMVTSPLPTQANRIKSIEFIKLDPSVNEVKAKLLELGILAPPHGFKKIFFLLRVHAKSCEGFEFQAFETSIQFFNSFEHEGNGERFDIELMVGLPDICRDDYSFDLHAYMDIVDPVGTPIILTQPAGILATIESEFIPMEDAYLLFASIIVPHHNPEESPYVYPLLIPDCTKSMTLDQCLNDLGKALVFGHNGDMTFTTSKSVSQEAPGNSYKASIPLTITFGINLDDIPATTLFQKLENVGGKASIHAEFAVDFVNIDDRRSTKSVTTKKLEVNKEISIKAIEDLESSSTTLFVFSFLIAATLIFAFL